VSFCAEDKVGNRGGKCEVNRQVFLLAYVIDQAYVAAGLQNGTSTIVTTAINKLQGVGEVK
jgi:hypothetical protein